VKPLHRCRFWLTVAGLLGWITATAESTHYLVAFSQDTLANDWRLAQVEAVRAELNRHPQVHFLVENARGNTALQVMQIDKLAARGVDVLIASPREATALTPVIRRVYQAGTPVILLSRSIDSQDYTSFVHPSNEAIARAAAKLLVERLGGQGTILMLEGVPGASTVRLRRDGFLDVTRQHPDIRVIARTANYLRADAIRAVEQTLATGPPFDAIYAQSDSMAEGARLALRHQGHNPADVPTVGIDYIGEARRAIRAGEQLASFTYATGGTEGARLALDILAGKPVPREIILESTLVTRDNADQVEPIF
jgi:ribose transport system substrate-binding protein